MSTPFLLREIRLGDEISIAKHLNNANVSNSLIDAVPYPYTEKDGKEFIIRTHQNDNSKLVRGIAVSNEIIGVTGVYRCEDVYRIGAKTGYWLSEEYWGKGIMTEAVKQMTELSFKQWSIDRVEARIFSSNPASMKVLEKADYQFEGIHKKAVIKNGKVLDSHMYAITRAELLLNQ